MQIKTKLKYDNEVSELKNQKKDRRCLKALPLADSQMAGRWLGANEMETYRDTYS